jgi:hypothetical protein
VGASLSTLRGEVLFGVGRRLLPHTVHIIPTIWLEYDKASALSFVLLRRAATNFAGGGAGRHPRPRHWVRYLTRRSPMQLVPSSHA